jgi:predicted nuclease with TOPRIM domain
MTQTPGEADDIRRIREQLEGLDEEFTRKSNILLDQIIVLDERMERADERLERISERQERTDAMLEQLADRFDQMVNNQITMQANIEQLNVFMTGFAYQAEADRAVMRQILEYLRNRYPGNGSGSPNQ